MARSKKNRKTSSKIERYSTNQTDPNRGFVNYEIVYESLEDLCGTIKFIDEETSDVEEKVNNYFAKHATEEDFDFPLDSYLDLITKFKTAKDKKKIQFKVSELKVLEKALGSHISYLASRPKNDWIKAKMAWANTAFKDKSFSYEKNLREAGRRLEFSEGAKTLSSQMLFSIPPKGKKKSHDPLIEAQQYERLILSGYNSQEAVKIVNAEFQHISLDACSRYLRKHGVGKVKSFDRDRTLHSRPTSP